MGLLFSRFRSKPSTKELLEDIQKEIDLLIEYKHSTELQQKTLIRSLVFYSVLIYLIIAAVFLFYSYPITTKDRLIYLIPFLIFPILLYILKKFLQWYFVQKIRRNDENLYELKKRKKSLLEFAMETETYKIVKELLEKYDPENHRKIFEPKPAITAPPSMKGSFSDMELRRRNISSKGPVVNPGQTITFNNSTVRPPMPPMPRPLLPRDRSITDRLVDYIVGDGPSNRYALICKQCHSHNGMALKEEFEYIAFRCCYCYQFNPPRNQHPPPPRLTLPQPSAPPAITEAPSSAASSSSDDTDIGNVSDTENTPIITQQDTSTEDMKESSSQRLSIGSDSSEIQANLVEDTPSSPSTDSNNLSNHNSSEGSPKQEHEKSEDNS